MRYNHQMRLSIFVQCLTMALPTVSFSAASDAASDYQWTRIGPAVVGAMIPVANQPGNPQVIAAGSDMGLIYVSQDGGKSWRICGSTKDGVSPAYRACSALAFDPQNPQVLWAGSCHGIFKSAD